MHCHRVILSGFFYWTIVICLTLKELYGDCDKLRQTVFKLATETEDNDSSLGENPNSPSTSLAKSMASLLV